MLHIFYSSDLVERLHLNPELTLTKPKYFQSAELKKNHIGDWCLINAPNDSLITFATAQVHLNCICTNIVCLACSYFQFLRQYLLLLRHYHFLFPSGSFRPVNKRPASSFAVETVTPFLSGPLHNFLPRCPTDGRGADQPLLVRSVTSVGHLAVARGASGRVRASPGARDRGHVSRCTAAAPQLQLLLICRLMFFCASASR